MREILTYGELMILTAFAIAFAIIAIARGLRQARYDVAAALFLLFGIPLLGGGILFLVYALPWICFDYCPPDIAPSIAGGLMAALSLGVLCVGIGWILALVSLARQRLWLRFALASLLPVAILLLSALALFQSIGGQSLPHTQTELG